MAASAKAEVKIGGRLLKLGMNELCEIEAAFDNKPAPEVFQALTVSPKMTDLRTIFAIALNTEPKEAGDLIDEVGFDAASGALGEAISAAYPEAKEGSGPRKAAR